MENDSKIFVGALPNGGSIRKLSFIKFEIEFRQFSAMKLNFSLECIIIFNAGLTGTKKDHSMSQKFGPNFFHGVFEVASTSKSPWKLSKVQI